MKLGILGGGQLGRMLALAAAPLGVRCRIYDPEEAPPASGYAEHVRGAFDDEAKLRAFAVGLDAITCEFESVPPGCLDTLIKAGAKLFPPPQAFAVAQDRLEEKTFFQALGIATAPFAAVDSLDDLEQAVRQLGFPAVLKTRRMGYDGKGQYILRGPDDLPKAWAELGSEPLIAEGWVPFTRELSILAVRSQGGDVRFWPLVANQHHDGILHTSHAPAAKLGEKTKREAQRIAEKALAAWNYVGVLTIELFDTAQGLVVNECAPRVHNSGHWTIEGARTSQFENHVRAGLDLPLGDCTATGEAVMFNVIGRVPALSQILAVPEAKLHLYGKKPRSGRKLGHITLIHSDASPLDTTISAVRKILAE